MVGPAAPTPMSSRNGQVAEIKRVLCCSPVRQISSPDPSVPFSAVSWRPESGTAMQKEADAISKPPNANMQPSTTPRKRSRQQKSCTECQRRKQKVN